MNSSAFGNFRGNLIFEHVPFRQCRQTSTQKSSFFDVASTGILGVLFALRSVFVRL